jgi:hypothetical protein
MLCSRTEATANSEIPTAATTARPAITSGSEIERRPPYSS